jgi:adenylate cyclase
MSQLAQFQRLSRRLWRMLLQGRRIPTGISLLVTLLVYLLFETSNPLLTGLRQRLDNIVYDQRFNMLPPGSLSSDPAIVIVDYDQKSLEREGQWPWSRFKLAELLERLAEHGALVVGFDVFFPEYERNLTRELRSRIELDPDYAELAGALLPQLEQYSDVFDGDRALADAMQLVDTVLGFSFSLDPGALGGMLPEPIFRIDAADRSVISLQSMRGYTGNVDVLQQAARGAGFFDTVPDIDGVIRSSPLVMQFGDDIYPSLALDMARLYLFADEFSADIEADATGRKRELHGVFMGGVRIPTDANGRVRVPYIGPSRSYPYLSASDVLRGTLTDAEQALLFNSLVLVGTTATGLYDLRATPVQEVYPGVEIHANILNAILNSSRALVVENQSAANAAGAGQQGGILSVLNEGRMSPFPVRPDWERGVIRLGIIVIGVVLAFLYPCLGPTLLAIASIGFLTGLTVLNFHLWSRYSLDFSLVILWLLIILIATVNMTYGFLKEGLSRRAIKGMFDQYVPPAHIDAMLDDPEKYNFEGESKELSVLFSDIRGFTSISEKLTAVQLKAMLNDFFTPITGIIFEQQGTIDKYVGDMVMAFWGAPLDDPHHREHAVGAALLMQQKVEELKPLFHEKGFPEVNVGVGINTGMMSVGDMGSTYRRSYTVLGDAVNLGSRLEGITKIYGVKILIGEQTYDGLKGFLCRQVDKVQVKGKEEPVRIYEPLCRQQDATPGLLALVDDYHRAFGLYQAQQWDAAAEQFRLLQQRDPATFLYGLYLERIADLRTQTLSADWDGSFRHTSK